MLNTKFDSTIRLPDRHISSSVTSVRARVPICCEIFDILLDFAYAISSRPHIASPILSTISNSTQQTVSNSVFAPSTHRGRTAAYTRTVYTHTQKSEALCAITDDLVPNHGPHDDLPRTACQPTKMSLRFCTPRAGPRDH